MDKKVIRTFQKCVYGYYEKHKRILPWRRTTVRPYHIFISEVMLQQTQVDRVVPAYQRFVRTFPNFKTLACASFPEVLKVWQGLGYNRRALFLHKSAQQVVNEYHGRLPADPEVLHTFPGIGKATAASICAFGFNMPTVFIETNIRSVYIHHFFHDRTDVTDHALLPIIDQTLDREHAHEWYSALMDYGVSLKRQYGNPSRKSKHHAKQSRFEGSDRQIRGAVIRLLNVHQAMTCAGIADWLTEDVTRVRSIVTKMMNEGLLAKRGTTYSVVE